MEDGEKEEERAEKILLLLNEIGKERPVRSVCQGGGNGTGHA